jgi:hypothetical protein
VAVQFSISLRVYQVQRQKIIIVFQYYGLKSVNFPFKIVQFISNIKGVMRKKNFHNFPSLFLIALIISTSVVRIFAYVYIRNIQHSFLPKAENGYVLTFREFFISAPF